ncbi:MAG: UvrD-helicase domain-containing protein [Deltaproteobacteria bacterium]|jgi:DNA helicase-2/ATP-dependent DNA helicase PcrA|nr:UvrD-helicase domain-containing protein [Deltaproteobacteria bacterium]
MALHSAPPDQLDLNSIKARYFADLHIHSRYSRATSQSITTESLDRWAKLKGLAVIGTGDLTHPGWLSELEEKLIPGDNGFYSLKENSQGTFFLPTGEVSAIYKQDGQTRKIHLVVISPTLESARRFSQALGARGNVLSDGRPIMGLSARNILEIALTSDPGSIVVPAHIWTPWFSLFGHKSGFDRLEDCFLDLSGHITALETGLSSDPAMNRLISALDKYHLISSSDAHSADKLGREATVIAGPPDRDKMWAALTSGDGLLGTVEFYPEEGKYHLDGHAHCGPALSPAQTIEVKGLCPVCGKPLTIGVLSRVLQLADRTEPGPRLPDFHILPLQELLCQVLGQGPTTQAVHSAYDRLLKIFESEFNLLMEVPLDELSSEVGPLLALGIERMRTGQVLTSGGFDGRFGTIEVLSARDREAARGQGFLFGPPSRPRGRPAVAKPSLAKLAEPKPTVVRRKKEPLQILSDLSSEQKAAVTCEARSLTVLAGPGSGKTLVLIRRAAFQSRRLGLSAGKILLTTYTNKAAETLAQRLREPLLGLGDPQSMTVSTLHALALSMAKKSYPDWSLAPADFLEKLLKSQAKAAELNPNRLSLAVGYWKNTGHMPPAMEDRENLESLIKGYQAALEENKYWDFDDLIKVAQNGSDPPWEMILADEFQDFSPSQYRLLLHLAKNASLTVIGDPDQSIYGFRGAKSFVFQDLKIDRPDLETIELTANYRSSSHICQLAEAARPSSLVDRKPRRCAYPGHSQKITRLTFNNPKEEAIFVAKRLREHLGVLDLGSEGRASRDRECLPNLTLSEVAIIFRWRIQAREMAKALDEEGLAWQLAGEEEMTAADGLDFKADKVNLLTIHAAKGLEFRLVFLVGLEEGLFPEKRDATEPVLDDKEEARLFYVALTRARERLYLTRCLFRQHYGRLLSGQPSPFWVNLDRYCLDRFLKPRQREKTASLF